MSTVCPKCCKRKRLEYAVCYDCHQQHLQVEEFKRYLAMTEQEKKDERNEYYSNECTVCGKEGASVRKDGKLYCSMCWTVWNS